MDPRDKTYSVVVFPLLKTSGPARLGSLEFRSTEDLNGLPEDRAASVTEITRMLFALGDQRIKRASYAIVDRVELRNAPMELDALGDIEAVVAYLYASPRHEFNALFLTPEHASIAVLTPNRVAAALVRLLHDVIDMHEHQSAEDANGFVDGYDGLVGFRHHFWVVPGSRLYGTTPRPTLNVHQDLASDLERFRSARADYRLLLELLNEPDRGGDIGHRVFTAIRWFNRANSEHRDEAESFICLSVAFETLLRLPQDAKTSRFIDVIDLLLGRPPRLEDWATQFHKARSRAVHEGAAGQAAFVPKSTSGKEKGATTYQSLLAYGREIFQLCLATVLTGASLSSRADLPTKLISNSERFETASRILNDDSQPLSVRLEQLDPLASAINRYLYVPDTGLTLPMMLGTCRAAARVTLQSTGEIDDRLRYALAALADAPRTDDHLDQLEALHTLVNHLKELQDRTATGVQYAVITLLEDTWHYSFQYYFSTKRAGEVPEAPAPRLR